MDVVTGMETRQVLEAGNREEVSHGSVYRASRTMAMEGFKKNQKLPKPIITPTTKPAQGEHDAPITESEVLETQLVTTEQWYELAERSLALFARGQELAAKKGLILARLWPFHAAKASVSVRRSNKARGICTMSGAPGDGAKSAMGHSSRRTAARASTKVGRDLSYQTACRVKRAC